MIDYDYVDQEMTVCCDKCDQDIYIGGVWHECIEQLKHLGWTFKKIKEGDWDNLCPECSKPIPAKEDF